MGIFGGGFGKAFDKSFMPAYQASYQEAIDEEREKKKEERRIRLAEAKLRNLLKTSTPKQRKQLAKQLGVEREKPTTVDSTQEVAAFTGTEEYDPNQPTLLPRLPERTQVPQTRGARVTSEDISTDEERVGGYIQGLEGADKEAAVGTAIERLLSGERQESVRKQEKRSERKGRKKAEKEKISGYYDLTASVWAQKEENKGKDVDAFYEENPNILRTNTRDSLVSQVLKNPSLAETLLAQARAEQDVAEKMGSDKRESQKEVLNKGLFGSPRSDDRRNLGATQTRISGPNWNKYKELKWIDKEGKVTNRLVKALGNNYDNIHKFIYLARSGDMPSPSALSSPEALNAAHSKKVSDEIELRNTTDRADTIAAAIELVQTGFINTPAKTPQQKMEFKLMEVTHKLKKAEKSFDRHTASEEARDNMVEAFELGLRAAPYRSKSTTDGWEGRGEGLPKFYIGIKTEASIDSEGIEEIQHSPTVIWNPMHERSKDDQKEAQAELEEVLTALGGVPAGDEGSHNYSGGNSSKYKRLMPSSGGGPFKD